MIEVFFIDKSTNFELPLFSDAVPAGFPSPADDYIENNLDLNKYLIQHPSSTFYIKVTGDSMVEANIYCGDILIIDRSIKIQNNDVALVILNGNFIKAALAGLSLIYKKEYQYKKASVIVTGIVPSSQIQADIFDVVNRQRNQKAMKVLDFLNQRYNTVKIASQGFAKGWEMKREMLSPSFTTSWKDLLVVKIYVLE